MFNEVEMVRSYLSGVNIPKRALDDCVFQISKYTKENGMNEIDTKKEILEWLRNNNLHFLDISNNIDNAFKTKAKLIGDFSVRINQTDIDKINFAADFQTSKRVALFILIYAKLHANDNGEFKIRVSTMSEWIGIDRANLYKRHITPLITYGFLENMEKSSYSKYLNQSRDEKRGSFRVPYRLENSGDFIIERNEDFQSLFDKIFTKNYRMEGIS